MKVFVNNWCCVTESHQAAASFGEALERGISKVKFPRSFTQIEWKMPKLSGLFFNKVSNPKSILRREVGMTSPLLKTSYKKDIMPPLRACLMYCRESDRHRIASNVRDIDSHGRGMATQWITKRRDNTLQPLSSVIGGMHLLSSVIIRKRMPPSAAVHFKKRFCGRSFPERYTWRKRMSRAPC